MSAAQVEQLEIRSSGSLGPWYVRFPSRDVPNDTASIDVAAVLECWSQREHCLLLESVNPSNYGELGQESGQPVEHETARYSFLMADPVHWFATGNALLSDWVQLGETVRRFHTDAWPQDLPPFIGGAAGLLSYDWCRALEKIAAPKRDDFQVPKLAIGVYDYVIAWDHLKNHVYVIANGFPHLDPDARKTNACQRISEVFNSLVTILTGSQSQNPPQATHASRPSHYMSTHLDLRNYYKVRAPELDKHFPSLTQVLTGSEFDQYLRSLLQAKRYLQAGDIFQVNLAQQLLTQLHSSPLQLYLRMRQVNAAPFAAYFDMGNHQLVSASPERLVSVRGQAVQTRPIKGTCPLTGDGPIDHAAAQSLLASVKDCAENIMIVDLLRNDLSRICEPDSIQVPHLCRLEPYRFVQHLTSVVTGRLPSNQSAWELVPALFPGGSISGAPKVRAMEIINELEPVARGAYCGSLGYIGFPNQAGQSNADWNILIRTITTCSGWCQIPVGGGIVLGSDPESEFRETFVKARGLLAAFD